MPTQPFGKSVKKKISRKVELTDRMSADGNNGGDTLDIEKLSDGRLRLSIGHCCVREIRHIVPVEFVTALLTKAVLDAGGVEAAMRTIPWQADFMDELIAKIEDSI